MHADIDAMEPYIEEFSKKLKEDSYAVIHHSNLAQYSDHKYFKDVNRRRSKEIDHLIVQELCKKYNLLCVQQELIPWGAS